jgi:hypothetical protein
MAVTKSTDFINKCGVYHERIFNKCGVYKAPYLSETNMTCVAFDGMLPSK